MLRKTDAFKLEVVEVSPGEVPGIEQVSIYAISICEIESIFGKSIYSFGYVVREIIIVTSASNVNPGASILVLVIVLGDDIVDGGRVSEVCMLIDVKAAVERVCKIYVGDMSLICGHVDAIV